MRMDVVHPEWTSYQEVEMGPSATAQFMPSEINATTENIGVGVAGLYVLPEGGATADQYSG